MNVKTKSLILSMILFVFFIEGQDRYLVIGGKTGWIGKKIITTLLEQGHTAIPTQARLEDRSALIEAIEAYKPTVIINAGGITGTPNVDWCEDHKIETVRANILGALNLFDIASQRNIYVVNIGTGCIYQYDDEHPMCSGVGFTEEDEPNFKGSFYSYTKGMLDRLILHYPNVLNLRIRMPISEDLHPRNFITKITNYKKVINIPNSMTVLPDLLPLIPELAKQRITGNLNFVNPGTISHNEILNLYTIYVDPNFTYENFSLEEQNKILKAQRSNNELDPSKLKRLFPNLNDINIAIKEVLSTAK